MTEQIGPGQRCVHCGGEYGEHNVNCRGQEHAKSKKIAADYRRERIATACLAALIGDGTDSWPGKCTDRSTNRELWTAWSQLAIGYADALIAELDK